MRTGLIVLIITALLGVFVLGGGCMVYSSYKTAIRLDEDVQSKWADIEVDLQRRYDLIPSVVETVKGYAAHEKDLFENIARSRERYFNASSRSERTEAAAGFGSVMSRLLFLKETYPQLKANENFRGLMVQLEGTENRIAEKRRRYNESVKDLNTHIRGPIGSIAAGWAGVERAERFKMDEQAKDAPKVDFGSG